MPKMRRKILAALPLGAILTLMAPAISLATLSEVGVIPATTTPPTTPSCPTSCLAVTRTTGFQVKVGKTRSLVAVPREGTVVAWTISLGKPNATQIKYFNSNEGGTAAAALAVLRPVPKPNLTYRLVAQGPTVQLQKYFGKTAQFPLASTLPVKKGDVLALAVPTWAPALALGFTNETSWRASRLRSQCSNTSIESMQQVGASVQYYCLYREARLTYSATLISTP
ncbi:MAG TPA: hypothetical protein VNV42_04600 [Solirubrobacteraceae bacterium]|jgi:hypothetical protein|nr:hypothetical protein [Solirubrobacteraceae bacterium]